MDKNRFSIVSTFDKQVFTESPQRFEFIADAANHIRTWERRYKALGLPELFYTIWDNFQRSWVDMTEFA